jgi:ribonucleoside-triphosphate reductase
VLKAVSSSLRLQILGLLFDRGALSYTELMGSLKLNPSRDAGRFAYHLKFLLGADLVEADVEARKYCLTDLGKMVIDVADLVEKKAARSKGMLVRTSRFALETFDANRIADSLIKEAKMAPELAQKVVKETEKRLLKSKTKYLTAPLVREVVNAVLIEKGLEEYRHKLTRLGLPVHEVTSLLNADGKTSEISASTVELAGDSVLKEYVLLNVLPRDIADAHLSGLLHISGLSQWVLKPTEIMHDLRFFFRNGTNLDKTSAFQALLSPPQNLESALSLTFNVCLNSAKEIGESQTIDYFNVFLAPYARNIESSRIKELLRLFVLNLSQYTDVTLGLELVVPGFLADKIAVEPNGNDKGKYGDFGEEAQLLTSLLIEIFHEESAMKPLLNPRIILKMRQEALTDERARAMLLKAYHAAANKTLLYFAHFSGEKNNSESLSSSGARLKADISGDWEVDTLRTGCLGSVVVNLPRIVHESQGDRSKFFELLRERLEMASRALEIKCRGLKNHSEALLPFLMQGVNSDPYFRLENSSRLINLAGLKEAVLAFRGKSIFEDEESMKFGEEIVQYVSDFVKKSGRRHGRRVLPAMLPDREASERLAQLDIERYGVAKVRFSGTREKPFYSIINRIGLSDAGLASDYLVVQQRLQALCAGGSLMVVELGEDEKTVDALSAASKQLVESSALGLFTYDRKLTYCIACKKSWFGLLHKCPSCSAVGTLAFLDRFAQS